MMPVRPVVLGYDAVSPLGTDFEDQWSKAAGGHSGIGPLTRFPLRENFPVQVAGEVADVDVTPCSTDPRNQYQGETRHHNPEPRDVQTS